MKILLYMGAMLLLLAAACSEDKGNYNYLPVNTKIVLKGLILSYSSIP